MTRLQELLAIELPIIQAPMAGVQGSSLTLAVSEAGALGSLPCAMLSLDVIRAELATIRAGTRRPFGVGYHHSPTATQLPPGPVLVVGGELGGAPPALALRPGRWP
jgi:NAD(P)H-dependent flavin oxidoreductase YrpB (nitropropane dioxygenase family)